MATPQLIKAAIPGRLGEIWIDVRTASPATPGPAVLIAHGFKGFKDWGMFPPLGERLARAGFTAIAFNVSGSGYDDLGESRFPERFGHNAFSTELADFEAVLVALDDARLGVPRPSSIGIVGHSRGGGMAVLTAARHSRIKALVTWAAISTVERWSPEQRRAWRERGRHDVVNARTGEVLPLDLDVLDDLEQNADTSLSIPAAARRLAIDWLVVHGEADEAVPVTEARQLRSLAQRASLLVIPEAGHTFGAVHPFKGMTPALEQVFDATVAFFAKQLG